MMNMAVTFYNPKNVNYSHSAALQNRVSINAGLQITTQYDFWNRTFNFLDNPMSYNLRKYFKIRDGRKNWNVQYKKKLDMKRMRKHKQNAQVLDAIREAQVIGRYNLGSYESGLAMDVLNDGRKQ